MYESITQCGKEEKRGNVTVRMFRPNAPIVDCQLFVSIHMYIDTYTYCLFIVVNKS